MAEELKQSSPAPGEPEAAGQHFERALRLVRTARVGVTPEDRRSAFVAAAAEFEKVLHIDPHYPGARTNLGYCLIELGRHGDAKREIELALQQCPQDVSALINYAVILKHNQTFDQAESCLRCALMLDPRRGQAARELAALLEHQHKYRAAADHLERYLEVTPHANDERAVRQRMKLLRQRAGWLELPDRLATPEGITADLRRRGAALLLDLPALAALWQLAVSLGSHVTWLGSSEKPLFVSLVYLYYLLSLESVGGSLGKIILNLRVRSGGRASWYSPLAVRQTLKLAPILLGFLIPLPWNLFLIGSLILIGGYSALRHRQAQSWYDRPSHTRVVEWGYGKYRILAGLASAGCLLAALLSWLR